MKSRIATGSIRDTDWQKEEYERAMRAKSAPAPVGTPGERGGRVPPFTKDEATMVLEARKPDEFHALKTRILALAREHGEYHSQMLVGLPLSQRNLIGTATNWLQNKGLIESTGETRISSPTSRRHSFVYRLTDKGRKLDTVPPVK